MNWKSIDAFPLPDRDVLEEHADEIEALSRELRSEMSDRFVGGNRETIEQSGALKPLTDAADELLGPVYGLTDERVEYVERYDEEYRLSDVDQTQLVDVEFGDEDGDGEAEVEDEASLDAGDALLQRL